MDRARGRKLLAEHLDSSKGLNHKSLRLSRPSLALQQMLAPQNKLRTGFRPKTLKRWDEALLSWPSSKRQNGQMAFWSSKNHAKVVPIV